ncbi:MAG TPA: GNAT family N-acetyltransferase [Solirubrobacteraceae bacterium]|nr:GNAT family N-acetyltransferase [Solirubrobacteraceae bacterium]
MAVTGEAQLDNPIYSALHGPHARFARVHGRVCRYREDVAPFLALPSTMSTEDWRDAAVLVAPGTYAAVRHTGLELPGDWQAVMTLELVQMICEQTIGAECPDAITLGDEDVPEMLELVARTEPGPFLPRTIELGDYLGIRKDGKLIAMAGERMRVDGWTEISAVCTSPEHRGRGLATALMRALAATIEGRSEGIFLHALSSNTGAIRLYEQLGFRVRETATLTVAGPKPTSG